MGWRIPKKDQKPMTFKVGDKVTWDSQANGSCTKKTGVVILVVPPKTRPGNILPDDVRAAHTTTIDPRSIGRPHESYVVSVHPSIASRHLTGGRVIGNHPPAKRRLYWPNVSALRRV